MTAKEQQEILDKIYHVLTELRTGEHCVDVGKIMAKHMLDLRDVIVLRNTIDNVKQGVK